MAVSLKRGDTRLIIDECEAHGLLRNEAAYVLATTRGEVGLAMKPIHEKGTRSYFNKYDIAHNPKKARELGNTKPGDGFLYRGRGYPQLTGRANYARAERELGVPFVANPDLMLESKNAAKVMVRGMVGGWFTGKKLSDYFTLKKSDYRNARRIINGMDRAAEFAGFAREYEAALLADGYGVHKAAKPPALKPQPAPAPVLTVEQRILLMPESDALKQLYPPPANTPMSGFKHVVFAVQSHLKALKYPPGGLDGKWGPLTEEALLAAQKANGIYPSGKVDEATVKGILSWKEREFVAAREGATPAKVEETVPVAQENAKTRWWSKIGAWLGVGVPAVGGVGQVVDATGQAKTIMESVKEYLPSTSAVVVSLVFVVILFFVIRSANRTSAQAAEDVRSGALR